jgi:hypothetical protein
MMRIYRRINEGKQGGRPSTNNIIETLLEGNTSFEIKTSLPTPTIIQLVDILSKQ